MENKQKYKQIEPDYKFNYFGYISVFKDNKIIARQKFLIFYFLIVINIINA